MSTPLNQCRLCGRSYWRKAGFSVTVAPTTVRKTRVKGTVTRVCITCAIKILGIEGDE